MKLNTIAEDIFGTDKPKPKKFVRANNISNGAVAIIAKWEGFEPRAYKDTDGQMVIGYGTRLPDKSYLTKKIDETEATRIMKNHLEANVVPYIKKTITRALNQNQWDALGSIVYNIGGPNFEKSTLAKVINDGKLDLIRKEWRRWNKSKGKVLQGLIDRREYEVNYFFS